MQVIPVLDILNGVVVQGIGGERHRYHPISSVLTPSRDPSVVMQSIRDTFGLTTFYVADLDAIEQREPNRCVVAELTRCAPSLMVDSGVRSNKDAQDLLDLGADRAIVGLETLPDQATAEELVASCHSEDLILSLDLKHGQPLSRNPLWSAMPPIELARRFSDLGFRNMIVLDLASVGTSHGIPTLKLCETMRSSLDLTSLITGGGVSGPNDLRQAEVSGVDGVLVASALHDGRLQPDDLPERTQ